MRVEGLWRKESGRRIANGLRRQRVRLNWPARADLIENAFRDLKCFAEKDGVYFHVTVHRADFIGNASMATDIDVPMGVHSVSLKLDGSATGCGTFSGGQLARDYECGAELIIQYSADLCAVQVFLKAAKIRAHDEDNCSEDDIILVDHAFDTDEIDNTWIFRQIRRALAFHRATSIMQNPSMLDKWHVRWLRFIDKRNRDGYLEKFRHLLTPWELLLFSVLVALISVFTSDKMLAWISNLAS